MKENEIKKNTTALKVKETVKKVTTAQHILLMMM